MFYERLWFKLILGVLLLFIGFTGFIVFTAFQDFRDEVTRLEENLLCHEVESIAAVLDNSLQGQLNLGNTLPSISEISRLLRGEAQVEEVQSILAQIKDSNDYVMGIRVIDTSGEIIGTSDSGLGVDLSDRDYFLSAMEGHQFISEISISRVTGNMFYAVASPVVDGGEIIGATSLVIDWGQMVEHLLHRDSTMHTKETFIIDNHGLYLYHQNPQSYQLLTDTVQDRPFGEEVLYGSDGFLRYGEGREGLWIAHVPLTITDWRIVSLDEEGVILSQVYQNRRKSILILSLSLLVVGLFLYIFLTKLIITPLNIFNIVIGKLKEGDLKVEIPVERKDELGAIASNLKATIESLHRMVEEVQKTAKEVLNISHSISEDNQDLSQRTEEQATSLEEVSSSIQSMSSTLMGSSTNASKADNLNDETLESVQRGEGVIREMKEAMEEITRGNQDIAEIISTVNDIAFQTNLLALNAAVEAARAGEEGKGFAVVASEVRNLAHRTTDSSGAIERLIQSSIERVARGNELMETTEEVLLEIVNNTQQTTKLVGEIADSLRTQSRSSDEINDAIKELNQVTQQNATMVETIATSSKEMRELAKVLSSQVDEFQI